MKFIYWKLDKVSCVLVCRNRQWFEDAKKELQDIWSIIETERVSGFEHRAPNRKTKKDAFDMLLGKPSTGCLLQIKKLNDVESENTLKLDININIDINGLNVN
jgi:hypothetical protein